MKYNKSNIRASIHDMKYNVNEKKKCVTCIIYYTIESDYFIDGVLYNLASYAKCGPSYTDLLKGRTKRAIGIAKCSDGDTFDIEIGKKIARAKAESNMYGECFRYITECINTLQSKFIDPVKGFAKKATDVIIHNTGYLRTF